jgi:hypothetical protein
MNRRAEVVVLVLILLLVVGLVVPMVLQVQMWEGRMRCWDSQKSLGLGMQNYQAHFGHFPPSTVDQAGLSPDRRLSWYVEVWGFMSGGEELLLDKGLAWDAEENRTPKYRLPKDNDRVEVIGQVGWLTCPSNPSRG